jgi:hypothetical protein
MITIIKQINELGLHSMHMPVTMIFGVLSMASWHITTIMISINYYWIAGTDSDHVFDIAKIVLPLLLAWIMFF